MKDLHSHLLYGIDDGSNSIEESILLLKELKSKGTNEIILTPHYIGNSKYNCNNSKKKELFDKLKERLKEEGIDIKIYLGNEVFITDNFLQLLKDDQIFTLNDSRYILFEFPLGPTYNNTSEIISELISKGYTPVLAHPERYHVFQEHPELAEEYLRMGIHFQGNFTSLFGKYGRSSEKTLKVLLKRKQITFLGSDIHHKVDVSRKKVEKKLLKITKDKQYVEDLLENNFDKVIKDEEIGILR